jgi:hypothetical protein
MSCQKVNLNYFKSSKLLLENWKMASFTWYNIPVVNETLVGLQRMKKPYDSIQN